MPDWKPLFGRLNPLFRIMVAITAVSSVIGFVGKGIWPLEQFSHFQAQYLFGLSAGALFFLATRRYAGAGVVGLLALLNLNQVLPGFLPPPEPIETPNRRILRIASVNVQASNRERKHLADFVANTDPDFLLLEEMDPSWQDFARQLKQRFADSRLLVTPGYFGLALYSRYAINRTEVRHFGEHSQYAIIADLQVDGQNLSIIGAHVTAPTEERFFNLRNRHFHELAEIARKIENPVILAGDLNASTWSPYFRELLQNTHLKDARQGFGIQPTWPVQVPFLRIPIDHCLVSDSIRVEHWKLGPNVGSDHFPILVDFSIEASTEHWASLH